MSDPVVPVIRTRVAHCGYGDTQFCGYSVRTELVGESGYWNSISLAVGGSHLSRDQEQILDGLSTASINADPRIWPLKIARLLSSYGSAVFGVTGALVALEAGYMGPPAIEAAARTQVELLPFANQGTLEDEVSRRLAGGGRLMGYGVPSREEDERVLAALNLVAKYDLAKGRFWQLMLAIEAIVLAKKNLRLNLASAAAAIYMDMGFVPSQIGLLGTLMLLNNIVANASEGAEQGERLILEFPREFVKYEGPPRRLSPRAAAMLVTPKP